MNQISLAEIVLGKDLAFGLRRFFRNSWSVPFGRQRDYRYRVYVTRRAFNLNEFFFSAECAQLRTHGMVDRMRQLEQIRRHTFITQHALCGYVDELVDAYEETGEFPAILIIDELAVYGHEITMVMQQFETLIKAAWRAKNGDLSVSAANRLDMAILKAVDLRVYAKSKESLLLKNHYKNQLSAMVEMNSREWKEYVQSVSRLLQTCSVIDNTNHCPTYMLSQEEYDHLSQALNDGPWKCSTWLYHTVREHIWQKQAQRPTDRVRLYETVRCYRVDNGKQIRLVPQVLFGAIPAEDADELCRQIREMLLSSGQDEDSLGHIGSLLKCEYEEFRGIRMQLVSYILCAAALYDFTQAGDLKDLELGKQEKPVQTFGTIDDVALILEKLLSTDIRQDLKTLICSFIEQNAAVLDARMLQPAGTDATQTKDACIRRAEQVLYGIAREDEIQAYKVRAARSIYDSQTRFANVISLQDYLGQVAEKGALDRSVAALLLMLDANIVSLTTSSDKDEVFFNLKAGELSKTLRARWMYRFMPALLDIENHCRLYGYNTVKMARRFGEYLDAKEQRSEYETLFYDFTNEIYSREQRLSDWDINLLSDLDMPKEESTGNGVRTVQEWSGQDWGPEWTTINACGSRIKYILWELRRQADYMQDAADFLRTKQI